MKHKKIKLLLCVLLIAALSTAPISALAASKGYVLKVATKDGSGANLRSSTDANHLDSTKDNVIATLKNGTKVVYWGVSKGQMLKVMTAGGKTGYIYKESLKSYGAVNRKQVYKTKAKTSVYRRSGSSYKKKGTVGKNVPLLVYGIRGKWAYVRNLNGTPGYIKLSKLKKVG